MNGWKFLTLQRTQMNKWTRKRRNKFLKRWRKQHHGQQFRWYKYEFYYQPATYPELQNMIFHVRE